MTDQTEFQGIVEHLANPLAERKARLVGNTSILLVLTWLILIVPIAIKVWTWAL